MSKFNDGDQIKIVESPELHELGLVGMIGREAMVLETTISKTTGRETGSWVRMLGGDYDGEAEWFIPVCSLQLTRRSKREQARVESDAESIHYEVGDGVAHVMA